MAAGLVRTLLAAALVSALMASATACAGDADPPVATPPATPAASPPVGPPAATPSTRDLSAVLRQPAGFAGVPGDVLSGPVTRSDVGKIFVDHPEDPAQILDHGFIEGYQRNWKKAASTPDATTVATGMVLRFDSAANAQTVIAYFRQRNLDDGYLPFAVPAQLTDGYGVRIGPQAGITYQGVAWTKGAYLYQVALQHTDPPASTDEVIALAVAQNAVDLG